MEIERPFYLNRLLRLKDNGRIKIITGMRRAGKSYLLFTLFRKNLLQKGVPEDCVISISLDALANARERNPGAL
ncbi:AAA family ATPase, partial [Dialister succinatiphilus]|uniref:AAA family ATPase n=1 Tax=Dialister succinatiphilus TaxID=487173 RepID=UPI0040272700